LLDFRSAVFKELELFCKFDPHEFDLVVLVTHDVVGPECEMLWSERLELPGLPEFGLLDLLLGIRVLRPLLTRVDVFLGDLAYFH